MLDTKDLELIGGVVRTIIREEVPPMVRTIVREELSSVMEHQIMPQFDLLHDRIDQLEVRMTNVESTMATKEDVAKLSQQMVTRGYVEDRFDKHLVDHHLKFRPA